MNKPDIMLEYDIICSAVIECMLHFKYDFEYSIGDEFSERRVFHILNIASKPVFVPTKGRGQ